jgi:hypothetical protein
MVAVATTPMILTMHHVASLVSATREPDSVDEFGCAEQ